MNEIEDGQRGSFENFAKYDYALEFAKLKGDNGDDKYLVEIKYDSTNKAYTEKIVPLFDIIEEDPIRLKWTGGQEEERHGVEIKEERPPHDLVRGHEFRSKYAPKHGLEVKKRIDEIVNKPNKVQERAAVASSSANDPPPTPPTIPNPVKPQVPLPPHLESMSDIPDGTVIISIDPGTRTPLAITVTVFGGPVRQAYEFKRYTGGKSKKEPRSVPAVTSTYYRINKEELAKFDKQTKTETDAVRNNSFVHKLLTLVQTGASSPFTLSRSLRGETDSPLSRRNRGGDEQEPQAPRRDARARMVPRPRAQ
jgi:hypothetical protein